MVSESMMVGEGIMLTVIDAGVVELSSVETTSKWCCVVRFPVTIFNACRSFA